MNLKEVFARIEEGVTGGGLEAANGCVGEDLEGLRMVLVEGCELYETLLHGFCITAAESPVLPSQAGCSTKIMSSAQERL